MEQRRGDFEARSRTNALLSQGPPERGTKQSPLTWLFEPESFTPLAKVTERTQFSIFTDHIGAPVLMTDSAGAAVWSTQHSVYGELRSLVGARHACPFRWPGQYEDLETGLYYNRYRYYDPESGEYTSPDPIGLIGGLAPYGYVSDPLTVTDPFGLAGQPVVFAESDLYSPAKGQSNTVTIPMQGSRSRDFVQADKAAGLTERPTDHTWHHVADFDPSTGNCTMQLVKTDVHSAVSHSGSVHQFEKEFKVKYDTAEAVDVSQKKGWLQGRPPRRKGSSCGGQGTSS